MTKEVLDIYSSGFIILPAKIPSGEFIVSSVNCEKEQNFNQLSLTIDVHVDIRNLILEYKVMEGLSTKMTACCLLIFEST